MCGRAQATPTCCRHRGRCRFARALSHVRLSYKRFSSFYSHVGCCGQSPWSDVVLILLLLYYRRGTKNARAANGFSRQQRNGHWEINCTFRTVSAPPTLPPNPATPPIVRWINVRFVGWTQHVYPYACWAYTVFEKHKSYACIGSMM